MALFRKSTKSKTCKGIEIGAPAAGNVVDITDVNDPTFAEKILGDGVAVEPSDGRFYAPCDGTLEAFYPTGHAYMIKSDSGTELLVHIGIDTVKLKGEFFTVHAVQGQKVSKGDLLVDVDLDKVKAAGYDTATPVIILNTDSYSEIKKNIGITDKLQTVMTLFKK